MQLQQPSLKRSREPNKRHHQEENHKDGDNASQSSFFDCAELVLPWLTPLELANTSLTCKSLHRISKSITTLRSSDASRTFENLPIPFLNSIDTQPYAFFLYTPAQIPSSSASPQRQSWGSSSSSHEPNWVAPFGAEMLRLVGGGGCGCRDYCGDGDGRCPCSRLHGLEDVVSECGPSCGCGSECGNRSTQRGVSVKMKIVRDEKKGWCLCADELIPRGRFVCEYAGELLTTNEARRRHQKYDELALGGRFSSALLVVREHLPSRKACLRLNIDATRIGNVARFINHSCDGGNLSTVLVRSSGALLPHLCFFASNDIKEGEELTFSYGGVRLRSKGSRCFCGSSSCFGWLPSEQT